MSSVYDEPRYARDDPELYREAAGLLIEHGHTKGVSEDNDGRMCMVGAILRSQWGNANYWDPWFGDDSVRPVIIDALGVEPLGWNNDRGRTSGEVIDGLLQVAKWCEEQRELQEA